MNKMKIFENSEFGTIRIVCDECGNPWFCGKDVAEALGYTNTAKSVRDHVSAQDKLTERIVLAGQHRYLKFINESGLYSLVLSSKLDSAKKFKHWVTSEVLPAIRKDGGYMVVGPEETNEVILARAVNILQKSLQRRDEQIAMLQPKADYADEVLESHTCFTITQIAKELNMTGNELNRKLCEKHVQYCQSGQYLPYAKFARAGYTRNRTYWEEKKGGRLFTSTYLVWTERGRRFIHQLFKGVA